MQCLVQCLTSSQVESIVFPNRPNYGKRGQECIVTANFYQADYNKNQLLYQYDVSLEGFEKTELVSSTKNRVQQGG